MALCRLSSAEMLPVSEAQQDLLGIRLETVSAQKDAATAILTLHADFAPNGEWVLRSPLSGTLSRILVQEGERVRSGQAVAIIQSAEYLALQRDFIRGEAQLALAAANLARDERLSEAGSISRRRLLETRNAQALAAVELADIRGRLALTALPESVLAELAASRKPSPELVLRSPAPATVLSVEAHLGMRLDSEDTVLSLGDTDALQLTAALASGSAAYLSDGMRMEAVDSDATARITFISSVIDPVSQTRTLRAQADEPTALRPGELSRWRVVQERPVLTLPGKAVVRLRGENVVYVAVPGGFEERMVSGQHSPGGLWFIESGLSEGERVASQGTAALKGLSLGMGGGD
jgi:cobalt-zinc-cadmium efflux system membrane fusion protein